MSDLTEASQGGESIILCDYPKKNNVEALAGTPLLLVGMAAPAWTVFLKKRMKPG